jgi:GxxExxY protein
MTSDNEFQVLHAEPTERIIRVFYKVANDLGFGFMESVYRRSMLIALQEAGLKVEEEKPITVSYRGRCVGTFFADLVVEEIVILELKTADQITK